MKYLFTYFTLLMLAISVVSFKLMFLFVNLLKEFNGSIIIIPIVMIIGLVGLGSYSAFSAGRIWKLRSIMNKELQALDNKDKESS